MSARGRVSGVASKVFGGGVATLAAFLGGGILILLAGSNPMTVYGELLKGGIFDYYGFASTLVRMCPLLLVSLSVVFPLRAGFFNVGGEGQVYIGALAATIAGLYFPESLPATVRIIFTIIVGGLGGALWALIPATLKIYRGTNEVITSLLLSYVAAYLVGGVIQLWLIEEGATFPYTRELSTDIQLPVFIPDTEAHVGIILAVIAAIFASVLLRYTTYGLAMRVCGNSQNVAQYAGINLRVVALTAFCGGGAFSGLAGALEILGVKYRLFDHFGQGYGFQGAIIAFMGNLSPLGAIVAAFFLAALQSGAGAMQRATGVDSMMVGALQGLIVLFVAVVVSLQARQSRHRPQG